jgi:murein DD-endopeptidase MepM/ murein hydrolase activator NlpD
MRSFVALVAFLLSAAAATYTLQPGDTLGGVARRHGVSVAALAQANRVADPNRVFAGQVLTIPGGGGGGGGAAPAAAPRAHVIASGETLGGIARRYGVSVSALASANGIANPNRIGVGQRLTVPGGRPAATWVCPVAGRTRFENDFGAPRGGGRGHEGIDMLAPRGTPVVASTRGVIVRHDQPRGGLAFYLRGDDGLTYYGAHLATFVRGDGRVRLGEIIGTVGDTGNARGGPTHLHFEIINSKGPKNPYGNLKSACPRG